MSAEAAFRFLTVGWGRELVERLWSGLAPGGPIRVSHLLHPRMTPSDWPAPREGLDLHYFREAGASPPMPEPDLDLLASLEQEGVPTVHNMILGDRVLSKLPYRDALAYATFLARRLAAAFEKLRPSAVVGGFDSLHTALGLAVARSRGIPWFALHYTVIPPGYAGFCDRLSPAARVRLPGGADEASLRSLAEESLRGFEQREVRAYAYIAPPPPSIAGHLSALPARSAALLRLVHRGRDGAFLRFTDEPGRFSVAGALARKRELARARRDLEWVDALDAPPRGRYALFALHTQPESSIDVWAPFFSNQPWVIELLSRSMPPDCRLLVKIHKSDVAKYTREQLERLRAFPGVELVRPFADTRRFIECASLVVGIQGTIGLEAALLGKPVIMLGESPVTVFPSATGIGRLDELPGLVRSKLDEPAPTRERIVAAYATYLAPFRPASHNDWTAPPSDGEAGRFAALFAALRDHVSALQ